MDGWQVHQAGVPTLLLEDWSAPAPIPQVVPGSTWNGEVCMGQEPVARPAPFVTIGMPVYNAERFLQSSIASIVAQDVPGLRLLIADNASTDGTAEICRRFAESDQRVTYVRHRKNIGLIPNFRWVMDNSRGRYFKWASADDRLLPGFLAAGVAALESDPSAVVAMSKMADIDLDDGDRVLRVVDEGLPTHDPDPVVRFRGLMGVHECVAQFGLFRLDTLRSIRPYSWTNEGDRVVLAELALRGRFVEVPEVLFHRGQHRSSTMKIERSVDRLAVLYPPLTGRVPFPTWRLGFELARAVHESPLDAGDQLACYSSMGTWLGDNWENLGRNLVRGGIEYYERTADVFRPTGRVGPRAER